MNLSCHGEEGATREPEESTRHARGSLSRRHFHWGNGGEERERELFAVRPPPSRRSPVFVNAHGLCAYRKRPKQGTHAPPFMMGARERVVSYQRWASRRCGGAFDPPLLPYHPLVRERERETWRFEGAIKKGERERNRSGADFWNTLSCKVLIISWEQYKKIEID